MGVAVYPWQKELAAELAALRNGMPNAVLVYGPRGIGTFDAVHEFAKALLCESPLENGDACTNCRGCNLAMQGNHPDIRYIVSEAESVPRNIPYVSPDSSTTERKNLHREILIHQPRQIAEFLTLGSHYGGMKVVLVYPADKIRAEAAASLLKNIEEPPANTVFLLVSDEIDRVLPTIKSRCRLIRVTPPSRQQSLDWLATRDVQDPESALMMAGGMPLGVFEVDPKLVMDTKSVRSILSCLEDGFALQPEKICSSVDKDVALQSATLLMMRWGWDMASCAVSGKARYYARHGERISELVMKADVRKLYVWINDITAIRRLGDHPVNAKLAVEALLIAYRKIFIA